MILINKTMPNQQLLDYINFKIKSGTSNEDTKKLLLESGWKEEDIDNAFAYENNISRPEVININLENESKNKSKKMSNWILALLLILASFILSFGLMFVFKSSSIVNIFGSVIRVFLIVGLIYIFLFRKVENNLQNIEEKNIQLTSINNIISLIYNFIFFISVLIIIALSVYSFGTNNNDGGLGFVIIGGIVLNVLIVSSIIMFLSSKNKVFYMKNKGVNIPKYFSLSYNLSKYSLIVTGFLLIASLLFSIRIYL